MNVTGVAGVAPLLSPAASADVLLTDGALAVIRPATGDDRAALDALHENASDESLRRRFFTAGHKAGHSYVEHIFSGDGPLACLVATVGGAVVGVVTAETTKKPDTVEVAFLVADFERGRGTGTLLLEHIAAWARHRGFTGLVADVLIDNLAMSHVLRDSGLVSSRTSSGGITHVDLALEGSPQSTALADIREFGSESQSLAPMLTPRCVAVVGNHDDVDGAGADLVRTIRTGGFTGHLVVVTPDAPDVGGSDTFARLVDVPQHVDIAIVTVPATEVLAVVADAGDAGVSSLVVTSRGAPDDESVGEQQRHLARAARTAGLRLVGPHSRGLLVNDPDVRLRAIPGVAAVAPGSLAVAVQSGASGAALLASAAQHGLGIGSLVTLGDKADVSGNDLVAAWLLDSRVTAVVLQLDSMGNAVKLARFARALTQVKPLLVLTSYVSGEIEIALAGTGARLFHSTEALVEAALHLDDEPSEPPVVETSYEIPPADDLPRQLRPIRPSSPGPSTLTLVSRDPAAWTP